MTDTYSTHTISLEPALRQAFRNLLDVDPYELDDLSGGQEAVADTSASTTSSTSVRTSLANRPGNC